MPRAATGRIESHTWKDGETVSWLLRVRANGRRHTIKLGTNVEGWNAERAQVELDTVAEQIRRGTWKPDRPRRRPSADDDETLHETLTAWWEAKRKRKLRPKTIEDYEWRLENLLRFRPETPTADINGGWVDGLTAELSARGLEPRSVNMCVGALAQALDLAVDDGLLDANPARDRRRKLAQPKPRRNFLEPDMVRDLLDAAGTWEAEVPEHQRYGRRALLALLCLAGPRIGETIAANRGDFDLSAGRWRIPESKTDAGERTVELSAFLVAELKPHAAAMKKLGRATKATDPMFPTATGGRMTATNVRRRALAGSLKRAAELRPDGAMALPANITPHALRRTYASLALAARAEVPFVMAQLGHSDPKMTLAVYAQVLQRKDLDRALIWELMRFRSDPKIDPMAPSPKKKPRRRGARSGVKVAH